VPFDRNQPRGPDGKWIKKSAAGGAVIAALIAATTSAIGGGGAVTSVGAGLDAATSQTAAEARTANGRNAAKKGDRAEAWRRMALKEINKNIKHDLRCAVQSHGQVQQFFLKHPCDKLDQLLFAVTGTKGDLIIGTVMWVKMPSSTSAQQLKNLEDTYGTGDVTPFGTEVLQLGAFRFTGKHYQSRVDGRLVVIAETEPARGHPSDTLLKQVATVADVLPPP
jgi:hypothetical protein